MTRAKGTAGSPPGPSRADKIRSHSTMRRAPANPEGREGASTALSRKRKDLKGIAIYMNPVAKRALDRIAFEHEKSVQELGIEAINLLLTQYGEKPLA